MNEQNGREAADGKAGADGLSNALIATDGGRGSFSLIASSSSLNKFQAQQ